MVRPISVAHATINVTDLDRAEKFYTEILGCRVAFKYEGKMVWLNFGQYREVIGGLGQGFHDLALYKVPHPIPEDSGKRAALNHVALRLRRPAEVDAAAEFLKSRNVKILKGPLTHKEDGDRFLYLEDPDQNVIELVSSTLPDWPQAYLASPGLEATSR